MHWSQEQVDELNYAGHHHATPSVRVKALAVRAVAKGHTRIEVAEMYATTRQSVGEWVRRFVHGGVEALSVEPGRGRKQTADDDQLRAYALQSPRNFGLDCSRWTLELLAETVPSLKGFSISGTRKALKRCGISYKRGQPWPTSPDPDFEKKTQ